MEAEKPIAEIIVEDATGALAWVGDELVYLVREPWICAKPPSTAADEDEYAEYWLGLKTGHEGGAWNAAASHDWKVGFSSGQDDVAQAEAMMAGNNG